MRLSFLVVPWSLPGVGRLTLQVWGPTVGDFEEVEEEELLRRFLVDCWPGVEL